MTRKYTKRSKALVKFTRLFESKGVYYAHADDGTTWSFTPEGEEFAATNDATLPEHTSTVTAHAWNKIGLPLEFEVPKEVAPPPEPKRSGYKHVGTAVPFVVVPCDLVVPVIRIRSKDGGSAVTYERTDVSTENKPIAHTSDHTEVVVRETKRTIVAKDEHDKMDAVRAWARNKIKGQCAVTILGWLSPRDKRDSLYTIIREVQGEIDKATAAAKFYLVTRGVVVAAIETDADVAAETVTEALRDAMEGLRAAFKEGNAEKMREIATGLKGFDSLVNVEAASKVRAALVEARKIATAIVKETEKNGRKMEDVVNELDTSAIDMARMMLVGQEGEVHEGEEEAVPEADGRNMDGEPAVDIDDAASA